MGGIDVEEEVQDNRKNAYCKLKLQYGLSLFMFRYPVQ